MDKKGLIIVYTGPGKGKTTAALGLAFRALGHGFPVCVIQFIKGLWKYGELTSAERFAELLQWHVVGEGFTWKGNNPDRHRRAAMQGWDLAKSVLSSGKHRLIVFDELTHALKKGMVRESDVVEALVQKPPGVHVLVTGRNAPESLLAIADLVTVMREVRHPLKAGVKAQQGIEF